MKVLFATSSYPTDSGDSRGIHVHRLAASLVDKGVDVGVVVPAGPTGPQEDTIDGVRIHRVNYWVRRHQRLAVGLGGIVPNLRSKPLLLLQLPLMLMALAVAIYRRSRDVDVVHAHWVIPSGALAALVCRGPLVITAHGGDLELISRTCGLRWITRWTLRRTDKALGVSEALTEQLADLGASPQAARFQPLGVDEGLLEAVASDVDSSAEPQPRHLRILQVGSLIERKQPGVLLEALRQLDSRGLEIETTFLGDGPLRPALEEAARRSEARVRFAGNVSPDAIPGWLNGADLLVLPSLSEGRPLVIMEAMACGVPVVASDIPGVRELVANGVTGLLVEPRNATALADAIEVIARDATTRSRFGFAARARLRDMGLLSSQVAHNHIRLYKEVCERQPDDCW